MARSTFTRNTLALLVAATLGAGAQSALAEQSFRSGRNAQAPAGENLPTGVRITPTAAAGALFQQLNPDLPDRPDFVAGQAVATSTSPDGKTLLILTSGYNRNNDQDAKRIPSESNEYVFIYDVSANVPVKRQVIQVPNTFNGIVWNPNGQEFYVSGGVDDNVHVYGLQDGTWAETGLVGLEHNDTGLGLRVRPMAAGLAVTADGKRLLVANFENDSASLVDLASKTKIAEIELRPGKVNPAQSGVAGGEFPFAVAIQGNTRAYVTSMRDREVVVIDLAAAQPGVVKRIAVGGQPNKMLLNRDQSRLYVANGNSDTVSVIDTKEEKVLEEFVASAPQAIFPQVREFKGANPNSLALTPDERFLLVTNGGTNSVAVVRLASLQRALDQKDVRNEEKDDREEQNEPGVDKSRVIGLIPTGWYPNSVSVAKDGRHLYVVNGKSNAGPNPGGCRDTASIEPGSLTNCQANNQYVWQLTKAGFLSMPMPSEQELAQLTMQVAKNNNFPVAARYEKAQKMMGFLRSKIKHVIYVVKENRTYDQILGDLEKGNGDPSLAVFPEPISPNHHQLARQFVTMDNFFDSGNTSNDGWNWTTAARTTDFTEKTIAVNYAGRGLSYDWEGNNRNINVGLATTAARIEANPYTPTDPDLLPGTADVAAPDSGKGEAGAGYLWDGALRQGLSVRNYGFFGDLSRYFLPPTDPAFIEPVTNPFESGEVQFYPTKAALMDISDPYFRGYDMKYADFWRYQEWEREFDAYAAQGNLPNLQLVRLPRDHFGNYADSGDGVDTPSTQMADNDYALGMLIEKISRSRYKDNTLIFVIEDDAQNGPDHVDAHRSIAYVVGPYVKQGALVSERYTTVNMMRTMKDILGIPAMGITDGLAEPMSEVFDKKQRKWSYNAIVPEILRTTELPLPEPTATNTLNKTRQNMVYTKPRQNAAYWEAAMRGQDFTTEDNLDEPRFNRALWKGLKGSVPYPAVRHGRDLTQNREALLKK